MVLRITSLALVALVAMMPSSAKPVKGGQVFASPARLRKLSNQAIAEIRQRYWSGETNSISMLARQFGVSRETARSAIRGTGAYARARELTPEEHLERFFWARVDEQTGCWEWLGARMTKGYGQIKTEYAGEVVNMYAHRYSFELHNGPVPEDLCVLHHCDYSPCVNPEHLFIGTKKDNTQDMVAKGRGKGRFTGLTHCTHDHEYTPENTRIDALGKRVCKTCSRERQRSYRLKKKGLV